VRKGSFYLVTILLVMIGLRVSALPSEPQSKSNPFLGVWNISGQGPDSAIVYWLELKENNGKLESLFLNRTSHPIPLTMVKIENNELTFQVSGTADKPTGPVFHAKVENGKLVGHHTVAVRGRAGAAGEPAPAASEREVTWVGVRPPVWPKADANAKHKFGEPVVLYDAEHMKMMPKMPLDDVWGIQGGDGKLAGWHVDEDGNFANDAPGGKNLLSKEKFYNFKVEVEYKLEPKSNSGIYLRGRYELQVLDDLTDTTTEKYLTQMAVYGRTPPLTLASKAPGEWQKMDATIVENKVTVHLNGKLVQNNTTIGGVTGGALDNNELTPGPLMIQGDHGHVWIRKVVVTPIK
jgi:hypothetical protein